MARNQVKRSEQIDEIDAFLAQFDDVPDAADETVKSAPPAGRKNKAGRRSGKGKKNKKSFYYDKILWRIFL